MYTFQFQKRSYLFTLNKKFFSLCSIFFILFCLLGCWQLHRYQYKKNLLTAFDARLGKLPRPLELLQGAPESFQFEPIAVSGTYANNLLMLVENRFHNGKLGYEVFTPLQVVGSQKLLLIDRGWIEKPNNAIIPPIASVKGITHLSGYIKLNDEYQFTLGKNIQDPKHKPLIMQKINFAEISNLTQRVYYPFIMRLDPSEPYGFVRDWVISSVIPARHVMYAVQWFTFALVITVAFCCFSIVRVQGTDAKD